MCVCVGGGNESLLLDCNVGELSRALSETIEKVNCLIPLASYSAVEFEDEFLGEF